jgi:hypothetical protein
MPGFLRVLVLSPPSLGALVTRRSKNERDTKGNDQIRHQEEYHLFHRQQAEF